MYYCQFIVHVKLWAYHCNNNNINRSILQYLMNHCLLVRVRHLFLYLPFSFHRVSSLHVSSQEDISSPLFSPPYAACRFSRASRSYDGRISPSPDSICSVPHGSGASFQQNCLYHLLPQGT